MAENGNDGYYYTPGSDESGSFFDIQNNTYSEPEIDRTYHPGGPYPEQQGIGLGRTLLAGGIIAVGAFIGYGKVSSGEATNILPWPSTDNTEQLQPEPKLTPAQYREALLHRARVYESMNIVETTPNHSKEIDKYFQMGLKGAKAEWCASFVSRIFYDVGAPFAGGNTDGYKGPEWQIEYVNNISRWVRDNNGEIFTADTIRNEASFAPRVGDIVVYNKDGVLFDNQPGRNHIGLVIGYDAAVDELVTIEGNYQDALTVRRRINPFQAQPGKRSDNIAGILRHPYLVEYDTPATESEQQKLHEMDVPAEVMEHLTASQYFSSVELAAQLKTESDFRSDVKSEDGAMGIAQFMPKTAEAFFEDGESPYNIEHSLRAQRKYMDYLYTYIEDLAESGLIRADSDDEIKRVTFAAYNAGQGNVKEYGGIPPFEETETYLKKIYGYLE